jgi:hypothetical protein
MTSFVVLPISPASAKIADELRKGVASLTGVTSLDLGGVWIVESEATADEIRDAVSAHLPEEDALIVFGVGEQAAWRGLSPNQADWLADHL